MLLADMWSLTGLVRQFVSGTWEQSRLSQCSFVSGAWWLYTQAVGSCWLVLVE